MTDQPEPGWEAATWEGSRREQLRRALRLTPRQRLAAMEALSETARYLSEPPHEGPATGPMADGRSRRTGPGKG